MKLYENSGDYLQAIINSLEDELMVINSDYRIIQANKAVLTRHGKRGEEVIGKYCYDVSHGLPEVPSQLGTTLFRVIQEAICNIARHAYARNANISLHFKKSVIRISVKDDGRGFDVEEVISSKDRPRGLGLLGMKERVELFNGTFSIRSHPGGGTKIDIKIPLNWKVSNG